MVFSSNLPVHLGQLQNRKFYVSSEGKKMEWWALGREFYEVFRRVSSKIGFIWLRAPQKNAKEMRFAQILLRPTFCGQALEKKERGTVDNTQLDSSIVSYLGLLRPSW